MGRLFDRIREAVARDHYYLTVHAKRRCLQRSIEDWQLVAQLDEAKLIQERVDDPSDLSVIVRQELLDGTEVEVVWAYDPTSQQALLVTVYIPE